MVADDLRIDMDGIDTKMPTEMDAKAKAVEERAGTDDAGLRCDFAGYIGQRVGRIGDDKQHRIGGGADDTRGRSRHSCRGAAAGPADRCGRWRRRSSR